MGDYLAATPVTRKATHAEIPVAFPSLIWKKSLETEERIALLCGFGVFFSFLFLAVLTKRVRKQEYMLLVSKYPK